MIITTISGWYVTVPTSTKDWKQLSTLYVESFDEPQEYQTQSDKSKLPSNPAIIKSYDYKTKLENIVWRGIEKGRTERLTYQRYVNTARRMKGTKYALLIIKDRIEGSSVEAGELKVVGMVELGLTMDQTIKRGTLQPRPTIGVLCVESKYRKSGIGKALVERCETLVADLWNDTALYTEIDPANVDAINFFKQCGYERCGDGGETVTVTVSRRRRTEECEHFLFRKSLYPPPCEYEEDYSTQ